MSPHVWLLANNLTATASLSDRLIGIVIWTGVVVLVVALMLIKRTRWGQSKPLSKCVALSVFAHLLLFLYAHGTRLMYYGPQPPGTDTIQLAFISSELPPADDAAETEPQPVPEPWETLPEEDAVPSQEGEVPRLETAAAEVMRATPAGLWTPDTVTLPHPDVPLAEPDRAAVEPPRPAAPKPVPAPVQPVAIEEVVPPQRADPAVTVPELVVPARMETVSPARSVADAQRETQLPADLMTFGSRMQELVEVAAHSDTADARAGHHDQLAESENRGMDAPGMLDEGVRSTAAGNLVALPSRANLPRVLATAAPLIIEQAVARATPRLGDGQPLPEPYRLRTLPIRREVAAALGGSTSAASAVEAALAWLAISQEQDGSWNASRWGGGLELKVAGHDREGAGTDADTGITGLAVLAFMGNGQTHLEGTYRKNIQRGLEYLLRSQSADGSLAGPARLYAKMYCHGIATLALSEALALTGDDRIRPYVERAVGFTVTAQHPTTGGWRYQPGDLGDMSQFGWQVMALKSASLAGISVPHHTREGMLHFLQRCEMGTHGGLSCYRPGTPPTRSMTAEALASRYFLDLAPDRTLVTEATDYLLSELPQADVPNLYYWYYGTLALFQVQGEAWTRWNEALQRQLLQLQRTDGNLAGSWNPDTLWGCYGGRVYSTAIATLCLEVYYRYLPLTALRSDRHRH